MKSPLYHYLAHLYSSRRTATASSASDVRLYNLEKSNNPMNEHKAVYVTLPLQHASTILFPGYTLIDEHLSVEFDGSFHYTARYQNVSNSNETKVGRIFFTRHGEEVECHLKKIVISPSLDHSVSQKIKEEFLSLEECEMLQLQENSTLYRNLLKTLFDEQKDALLKQLFDLEKHSSEFEKILEEIIRFTDTSKQMLKFQENYDHLSQLTQYIEILIENIKQQHDYQSSVPSYHFSNLMTTCPAWIDFMQKQEEVSAAIYASSDGEIPIVASTKSSKFSSTSKKHTKKKKAILSNFVPGLRMPQKLEEILVEARKKFEHGKQYDEAIRAGNLEEIDLLHENFSKQPALFFYLSNFFYTMLNTSPEDITLLEKLRKIGDYFSQKEPEVYFAILKAFSCSVNVFKFKKIELVAGPLFTSLLRGNLSFFYMLLDHRVDPNQEVVYYLGPIERLKFQLFPVVEVFLTSHLSIEAVKIIERLSELNAKMPSHPEIVIKAYASKIVLDETGGFMRQRIKGKKTNAIMLDSNNDYISNFFEELKSYTSREDYYMVQLAEASILPASFSQKALRLNSSSKKKSIYLTRKIDPYLKEVLYALAILDIDANARLFDKIIFLFSNGSSEPFLQASFVNAATPNFFCFNSQDAMNQIGEEIYEPENSKKSKISYLFFIPDNDSRDFFQHIFENLKSSFLSLSEIEQRATLSSFGSSRMQAWFGILGIGLLDRPELADYQLLLQFCVILNCEKISVFNLALIDRQPNAIKSALKEDANYKILLPGMANFLMQHMQTIKRATDSIKLTIMKKISANKNELVIFQNELSELGGAISYIAQMQGEDKMLKIQEMLSKFFQALFSEIFHFPESRTSMLKESLKMLVLELNINHHFNICFAEEFPQRLSAAASFFNAESKESSDSSLARPGLK